MMQPPRGCGPSEKQRAFTRRQRRGERYAAARFRPHSPLAAPNLILNPLLGMSFRETDSEEIGSRRAKRIGNRLLPAILTNGETIEELTCPEPVAGPPRTFLLENRRKIQLRGEHAGSPEIMSARKAISADWGLPSRHARCRLLSFPRFMPATVYDRHTFRTPRFSARSGGG